MEIHDLYYQEPVPCTAILAKNDEVKILREFFGDKGAKIILGSLNRRELQSFLQKIQGGDDD